jgi:WD40 repeat protein
LVNNLPMMAAIIAATLLLAGCNAPARIPPTSLSGQPILQSVTPIQRTSSPSPVTQPVSPSATLAPTTAELGTTATPTAGYPSPYPEPFLPPVLEVIQAENIDRLVQLTSLPVSEIYQLEFSPSGNLLATLSEPSEDRFNDYMEVWDLTTGKQVLLVDHWNSPWGLFFPPDEATLYADDRQYDLLSSEIVATLPAVPEDFTSDGETYTTGEYLGDREISIIRLVDVHRGTEVYSTTYPGMVMSLEFSPDSRWLSGGFQGNHFHDVVWEVSSKEIKADLIDYDASLTFSPDGSLAATTKNYQVYLFDAHQMTWLNTIAFSDANANPYVQDFSIAGDVLAIDDRYTVHFIDPLTGNRLASLDNECSAKFSPDGKILLTWCYQSDLKIWGVMP